MKVIAKSRPETNPYASRRLAVIVAAVSAGLLSGCTSALDIFPTGKVDTALTTGSVRPQDNRPSDETTIRNAVSSVDIVRNAGDPIPWANSASGSAGVITSIAESRDPAGRLCRDFITTRHSYQGIARFSGQTCATSSGDWLLLSLDRQG